MAKYAPIRQDKSDDSDLEPTSPSANGERRDGAQTTTYLWANARVLGIIVLYCAIGSSLSVLNKVAVTMIPAPNFILFCQFAATTLLLLAAHGLKLVTVEPLTKEIALAFLPLTLSFFALLLAGMEVMQRAPLETFIAVKSLTPVVFSLNEYLFLGRALPTPKSALALVGIVVGAVFYVNLDIFSTATAYAFCALFIVAAAEGVGDTAAMLCVDTLGRRQLQMVAYALTAIATTTLAVGVDGKGSLEPLAAAIEGGQDVTECVRIVEETAGEVGRQEDAAVSAGG